jgi:hypothetical protein
VAVAHLTRFKLALISLCLFILLSSAFSTQIVRADELPSITITSPGSSSIQNGSFEIKAITTSSLSNPAKIGNLGIRIVGLSGYSDLLDLSIQLDGCGNDCYGRDDTAWPPGQEGGPRTFYFKPYNPFEANGKLLFHLDVTHMPYQTYQVTLFTMNTDNFRSVSKTIEFTRKRALIKTVDAKISCKTIESIIGKDSYILCTSNYDLPPVPISIEYKVSNSWKKMSMAWTEHLEGVSRQINAPNPNVGTITMRVTSVGLKKQLDPYRTNIEVNPFISNEFIVNTVAVPKPKTDTSAPKSSSTEAKQKSAKQIYLVAPLWLGQTEKSIRKDVFTSKQKIFLSFTTAPGYTRSGNCRVQQDGVVVDQNPKPRTKMKVGANGYVTIMLFLDC